MSNLAKQRPTRVLRPGSNALLIETCARFNALEQQIAALRDDARPHNQAPE
ncbi:MAG: hypothetical protein J2P47_08960 [Acetobacteraceae bacterium]|nr:hypothetical protein [Acetobacteraceae bacterium]